MQKETAPDVVELERRHRDVMLDLVLVWASIDGALSMLVANVRLQRWTDAASKVRKLRGSAKLAEVIRALKASEEGHEAARKLQMIKRRYEKYSLLRDHIAHSRCVGARKDNRDFVVFLTFERVDDERLAVYQVPIDEFREALKWGTKLMESLFLWTRIRPES